MSSALSGGRVAERPVGSPIMPVKSPIRKDDGVAEILKVFELAQQHGVAEMEIGRGGIEAGFHPQRLAGGERLLQLGAQLGLLHNFRGALLDVGQLFVNGRERGHRVKIIAAGGRLEISDSRFQISNP